MLKIVLLSLVVAAASASLLSDWKIYKTKYNKVYNSIDEEQERHYVWSLNRNRIQIHNEKFGNGESPYYLQENEYADMTVAEFVNVMNGIRVNKEIKAENVEQVNTTSLPSSVDWRTKGYVTPVKNQGQCGSCWAFSATGSLEGAHMKTTGQLVSLSESNLVDCSRKWGNMGCNGGLMDQAFQYVIDNKGLDTEDGYPYVPSERKCQFGPTVGTTEKSYTDVSQGSESALQKAVAEVGPISVAIDASHSSFQLYGGGVYDEPQCSSSQLDHGVLAVGYGVDSGKDYWLVKNSWGKTWGLKGYIMMSRNKNNQCGIASMASYPTV